MIKSLVISVCFGIFYSWTPALVDVYPAIASPISETASTPVTLLLLGSCLCVLAFWSKRPKIEE